MSVFGFISLAVIVWIIIRNPLIAIPSAMLLLGFVGPDFFGPQSKPLLSLIGTLAIPLLFIGIIATAIIHKNRTGHHGVNL